MGVGADVGRGDLHLEIDRMGVAGTGLQQVVPLEFELPALALGEDGRAEFLKPLGDHRFELIGFLIRCHDPQDDVDAVEGGHGGPELSQADEPPRILAVDADLAIEDGAAVAIGAGGATPCRGLDRSRGLTGGGV
ncbi:hypothetical protein [Thiorhodococcus mannitoliphagus]|uniref:hypothetical protein n=1 Tax=Thiorhodococcus mannitoliphagus TaxID=329406 RepID=UPI001F0D4071|nr:hypothetical protein [Thiorhodococcus mannitoliphagus]